MVKTKNLFVGIDLGGKEKKTTGICILEERDKKLFFLKEYCSSCQDIEGQSLFKIMNPYLKETKVIAIDAPLTKGRGKGNMRLYEKFLSTEIFRQEKMNPVPPALIPFLSSFAQEILKKLEEKGFILDTNIIETFSNFTQKIVQKDFYSQFLKERNPCWTQNQKSAFICAIMAFLHSNFKTRYLGYKDGFVFLPDFSFWKEGWKQKFCQIWDQRSKLRYRYLITNIFTPTPNEDIRIHPHTK